MSIYNRFAFMSSLLKKRLLGGRAPLVVVLNVTFRCNLRCGYCYGQYFDRKEKDFTTKDLLGLIDELAGMGAKSITLGGGEPLIREDIGEIIRKIKSRGIECGMNTNGIFIPLRVKELKHIDMVTVSIDGPKTMNDLSRGAGSFEKIMAGIDAALEAGIKTHTTTVINRYNYECVDWMVNLAKQKGIQAEFNLLFHQSKDKDDSDRFMPDNELLRRAVQRVVQLNAQGAPILFSEEVYRFVSQWPDYRTRLIIGDKPSFPYFPCYAGRFMAFIDADGRTYPCVQLIDTFAALDFRKAGIKRAWDNCAGHNCQACYFPCFNEFNAIMSMHPGIIWKQVKSTLKNH